MVEYQLELKTPAALFISVFLGSVAWADEDFDTIASNYVSITIPVLEKFCLDCHDADTKKGELDLERFESLTEIRRAPEIWQKVFEQIESEEMPPKGEKQLDPKQREILLSWTRGYLDAEALASAGDPGPVTPPAAQQRGIHLYHPRSHRRRITRSCKAVSGRQRGRRRFHQYRRGIGHVSRLVG